MKKQFKFKPLVIAAAVVAACSAMAITAGALLKAPTKFTVNDMEVEPYYNEYKDELGNDIVMYVIDVPDFALGKAVEGNTAVGDIRVVPNPEYPSKWGEYMIVDELGNEFHVGINDKIVMYELNGKDGIGTFDCSNFLKDEYEYVQIISGEDEAHTYNMLQEFYFVPRGQAGEILKDRGYYAD
ncbi:MAG: hypothetical protein HDR72_05025 [Ruminococcaceae bacterium]|nr:hypothetical protein [Oscillospiraceae bacterium]